MVYYTKVPDSSEGQVKIIRALKDMHFANLNGLQVLSERLVIQKKPINDKEKRWLQNILDEHRIYVVDPLYDVCHLPWDSD